MQQFTDSLTRSDEPIKIVCLATVALERVGKAKLQTKDEFCLGRLEKLELDLMEMRAKLEQMVVDSVEGWSVAGRRSMSQWLESIEGRLFPRALFSIAFELTILEAVRDHLRSKVCGGEWSTSLASAAI